MELWPWLIQILRGLKLLPTCLPVCPSVDPAPLRPFALEVPAICPSSVNASPSASPVTFDPIPHDDPTACLGPDCYMRIVDNSFKIASLAALLAAWLWRATHEPEMIHRHFADLLHCDVSEVEKAFDPEYKFSVAKNVRTVLRRQFANTVDVNPRDPESEERPVCQFVSEDKFARCLGKLGTRTALFTLARVYDEAHITLCHGRSAARRGKPHDAAFKKNPRIDLGALADQVQRNNAVIDGQIVLEHKKPDEPYKAIWKAMPSMDFSDLPELDSLAGLLPGESTPSHGYAGIGGGGGSDIISASLLGHLLRGHGKDMQLLVSTRTWATGSQGLEGSKMGIQRIIYNHGGHVQADGRDVPGTFLVTEDTSSEGRPLEAIPVKDFEQIFIVLDQGESRSDIPEADRADLKDQMRAVLFQAKRPIQTVAIVDTGGDVFGADAGTSSTPDQDLRVQQAISSANLSAYNLVTAVIAPGVDAPDDAPKKAKQSGGARYRPTVSERRMLLDLLKDEYKMDGKSPGRFGKTTLALQARLRDETGWTSLDLPEHIVDTWENPWSSFVYIRECMSDIIFMPTTKLLPLIETNAE